MSRLRNNVLPWQQGVADCNPGSQYHWLNQRANQGNMTRLLSRHSDNPTVTEDYLGTLSRLTGARHERLFKGLWVSEEGLVYDEWDQAKHLIERDALTRDMKWHFASVDWGYRAPGCCQVWGVDGEDNLYRLAEVYRTQKPYEWWADVVSDLHAEFNLSAVVCDPAEPRSIDMLNDRLGSPSGRSNARLARKADNDIMAGLDMVRWALRPTKEGPPRLRFVKGALRHGRDPELAEGLSPCCTEEEFPGFVWLKQQDGRVLKERPDPGCPDHGLDCVRYAAMFAWNRNLSQRVEGPMFPAGSLGDVLDHEEILVEL